MFWNSVIEGYLKAFGGMYIHSPEQDHISFTTPNFVAIKKYDENL